MAVDHNVAASARFWQTDRLTTSTPRGIPLQEVNPPEWLTNRAKATSLPLPVHTDPSWTFDQDGFDKESFFKEAKATEAHISVLRNRFDKYASKLNAERHRVVSAVSLQDFQMINQSFQICKPEDEEHFFRAMDQSGKGYLSFDDFLTGCTAANPQTPHILNSHTGLVRARFIFDFYNESRSGFLDFEELALMMADVHRKSLPEDGLPEENLHDNRQSGAELLRLAHELGQVRRKIARELHVPVDGQDLFIGDMSVGEADVLGKILADLNIDRSKIGVTVLRRADCDTWIGSCKPAASASDEVNGLEKLVHVTFQSLYEALRSGEKLRGTSRLFRFKRSLMQQTKQQTKKVERGGANLGGA